MNNPVWSQPAHRDASVQRARRAPDPGRVENRCVDHKLRQHEFRQLLGGPEEEGEDSHKKWSEPSAGQQDGLTTRWEKGKEKGGRQVGWHQGAGA